MWTLSLLVYGRSLYPFFWQSVTVDCGVSHWSIHTQACGSQKFSPMLNQIVNRLSALDMMPIKIMPIHFMLQKVQRTVIKAAQLT